MPYEKKATYAMTIDVEDYFHVAAFNRVIAPADWHNYPTRVVENTNKLLALFDNHGVKSTFFILGWVAERFPELVKQINSRGHEIASHGYSHQLVFQQEPAVFKEETKKSKDLLEQIIGRPITGYRAASYSITQKSIWALDILAELGFTWDSSIFPIHHDTYGISSSPKEPYIITTTSGAELLEMPLTTVKLMGVPVPAAGGGYFRQYPYPLSKWLIKRASNNGELPTVFYLHPWEIDPEQPRIPNAGWKSNFRHYTNLSRCYSRLSKLLQDFHFTTMQKVLADFPVSKRLTVSELSNGQ